MRFRSLAAALVALSALSVSAVAHAQRPQPRPQRVDPLTASIRGRVTTTDTGAPIRGAEVRLSSQSGYSRLVLTTGDGRYEHRDLPAGEYRVTVSRTGFITLEVGQRRPFEAGSVITLAEGQTATGNVALLRGGVITGKVLDQFGDPAVGTRIQVLRSRMSQGRRRLHSVGPGDQTDDTGAFRLYGLPPGEYYVAAATGLADAVTRDPPIYYPGTSSLTEAQPITLGAGAEAAADFQIVATRTSRITGIVVNAAGAPEAAMINLYSEVVGIGPNMGGGGAPPLNLHAESGPDGRFSIENIPPGPYTLSATVFRELMGPRPAGAPENMVFRHPESVSMPVVIAGDEMNDVTLVTRGAGFISGRIVADTGVAAPLPPVRLNIRGAGAGAIMSIGSGTSQGEFRMASSGGPVTLGVLEIPDDWMLKAILLDGKDVTDDTIDARGDVAGIRVVMTNRVTSVSGVVESRGDAGGQGVLIFPDDPGKWNWPSRFVKTTRSDADGRFMIRALPLGERYLAVALDYLEDGDEQDPQLLERLRTRATSFLLGEGEQRSLQLEVRGR